MPILSSMTQNISVEEYLTLLEQMKQMALCDMDTFRKKKNVQGMSTYFHFWG